MYLSISLYISLSIYLSLSISLSLYIYIYISIHTAIIHLMLFSFFRDPCHADRAGVPCRGLSESPLSLSTCMYDTYMYMYVHIYIYMYVCIYIYIHI